MSRNKDGGSKHEVAIVIPNWNGIDFIEACLRSLVHQTDQNYQVLVVDNGSVDGSKDLIRQKFPQMRLIELDRNYGFAGGVNRGIKVALKEDFDAIALFNNDAVADKGWLEALVAAMKPGVGIVTSRFVTLDGKQIDSTGDFYSTWGLPFPRGRDEPNQPTRYSKLEPVFGGSGGASLYNSAMLAEIGLLDEDFFAYYEDIDLSFRAQLAGWGVIYQPKAVAYHHVGGTSSKVTGLSRYHSVKNLFFVYTKNMPGRLYWKYLPRFWIAMSLVAFNSLRTGRAGTLPKSWAVAAWRFPKMVTKRWQIQHRRKVSVAQIDQLLYQSLPPTQIKAIKAFSRLPLIHRWVKSMEQTESPHD